MTLKSLLIVSFYYHCLKSSFIYKTILNSFISWLNRARATFKLLTSICNTFSLKFSTIVTLNWKTVPKGFCRKKPSPSLLLTLLYYIAKPNAMIYKICTLSPEFSEEKLYAQHVQHSWGWLFLWRNSQRDHRSSMFCLRPHGGLLANYSARQVMQSKIGQSIDLIM